MTKLSKKKQLVGDLVEISVFANNTQYQGSGETLEDALNKITPPEIFTTSVDIQITQNGVAKRNMIRASMAWKLFSPDIAIRDIVLGNLRVLFDL